MKRSYQKVITKEVKILRFMRNSRSLSMRKAGEVVGVSGACINHIENGRMDISENLLSRLLKGYKYTQKNILICM